MIATFPAPPGSTIDLGPLSLHAYGVLIALGVIAGLSLASRRLEASGAGSRDAMNSIGVAGVIAGIVGARIYYIVTDKADVWRRPGQWVKVWEGGLGIPGGLLAGILVAAWVARRKGVAVGAVLTAAAPGIPLAQAIGRWGNWFNEELYGRPTKLPWALEVTGTTTTFHPTFLYESLWNLALCAALLWLDRARPMKPGRLMAVYVAGYAFGRFFVESLRIDPASSGGGLRLNQWTAIVAFIAATGFLMVDRRRP